RARNPVGSKFSCKRILMRFGIRIQSTGGARYAQGFDAKRQNRRRALRSQSPRLQSSLAALAENEDCRAVTLVEADYAAAGSTKFVGCSFWLSARRNFDSALFCNCRMR